MKNKNVFRLTLVFSVIQILFLIIFGFWLTLQSSMLGTQNQWLPLIIQLLSPYLTVDVAQLVVQVINASFLLELLRHGIISFVFLFAFIWIQLKTKQAPTAVGTILSGSILLSLILYQVITNPFVILSSFQSYFSMRNIILLVLTFIQLILFLYATYQAFQEKKLSVSMFLMPQSMNKLFIIGMVLLVVFVTISTATLFVSHTYIQQRISSLSLIPSLSLSNGVPDELMLNLPLDIKNSIEGLNLGIPTSLNISPFIKQIPFISFNTSVYNAYINQWLSLQVASYALPILSKYYMGCMLSGALVIAYFIQRYIKLLPILELIIFDSLILLLFIWSFQGLPIFFLFSTILLCCWAALKTYAFYKSREAVEAVVSHDQNTAS